MSEEHSLLERLRASLKGAGSGDPLGWFAAVCDAGECTAAGLGDEAARTMVAALDDAPEHRRRPPCACGNWAQWLRHTPVDEDARTHLQQSLLRVLDDVADGILRFGCPVRAWLLLRHSRARGQVIGLGCRQTLPFGEDAPITSEVRPVLQLTLTHLPGRGPTAFQATAPFGRFRHNGRLCTIADLRDGDIIEPAQSRNVSLQFSTRPVDVVGVRPNHVPQAPHFFLFQGNGMSIGPRAADVVVPWMGEDSRCRVLAEGEWYWLEYEDGEVSSRLRPRGRADDRMGYARTGRLGVQGERWPHRGPLPRPPALDIGAAMAELDALFATDYGEATWLKTMTLAADLVDCEAAEAAAVLDFLLQKLDSWPPGENRPPCPCGTWPAWLARIPKDPSARKFWLRRFRPSRGDWPPPDDRCSSCPARGWLVAEPHRPSEPRRVLALRCSQGLVPNADGTDFDLVAAHADEYWERGFFKLGLGLARDARTDSRGPHGLHLLQIEAEHPDARIGGEPADARSIWLGHGEGIDLGLRSYVFHARIPPGTLHIVEPGDAERFYHQLDRAEVSVGRRPGNDVVIANRKLSPTHCRLVFQDGKHFVVDSDSITGTYLNERRIAGPQVVRSSDIIRIGDVLLVVYPVLPETGSF